MNVQVNHYQEEHADDFNWLMLIMSNRLHFEKKRLHTKLRLKLNARDFHCLNIFSLYVL